MKQILSTRSAQIGSPVAPSLGEAFRDFLDNPSYPCVGAKLALAQGSIKTHEFGALGGYANDRPMLDGISAFVDMIEAIDCNEKIVHSYVAIFKGPKDMNEVQFESVLWSQLWRLHRLDLLAGNGAADDVCGDANSPTFSLSIMEHPFFVIGLHPHASRLARRFSNPVLVFNSHRQFEALRADGRYAKMQAATRARELDLQGTINPNLADFGDASEARQYSGRKVEADWRCPYDFKRTG